jgi:thymidylate kinase
MKLKGEPKTKSPISDGEPSAASIVVQKVFSLLEAESVNYCLTHGYHDLPQSWGSDIDMLIDRSITMETLLGILTRHEAHIGAKVVCRDGQRIVLASKAASGMPQLIVLDFFYDLWIGRCLLFAGEHLLESRRSLRGFWVPSAAAAFEIELVKGISKNQCGPDVTSRLTELFAANSREIQATVQLRWPPDMASRIFSAAETGKWNNIATESTQLWRQMAVTLTRNTPKKTLLGFIHANLGRIGRVMRPRGRHIVLLGPDGAGKSSTIEALVQVLNPLFARSEVRGFAPSLRQLLRRPHGSTSAPHGLPPRSVAASMLRTTYWLCHAIFSHVSVRWAKTRSVLVLNDRHFIDILVDPVRYRYSGPLWPLKLVSRLTPKPDLLILLSGAPEIIQARKQELTVAETARLCRAYEKLVDPLRYGRTIDAGTPFDQVVGGVVAAVITTL